MIKQIGCRRQQLSAQPFERLGIGELLAVAKKTSVHLALCPYYPAINAKALKVAKGARKS
jgi:hypothetical protein